MSVKQQLAAAVEDLPEGVTLEDAFARLYQAFKLKQMRTTPRSLRHPPVELKGTLQIYGDLLAPALDPDSWEMLQ